MEERPAIFIPGKVAPGAQWMGGTQRAGLDMVTKRKKTHPCCESNPTTQSVA